MSNLIATWPAPSHISALTTSRSAGHSLFPYDGNNLALHVGDNPLHVELNRKALIEALRLPSEPTWLQQIHSARCVLVDSEETREADAAITRDPQKVLAIMTADCLPILLCDKHGTEIAAIHAGWRGLVQGIIENTLAKLESKPQDLLAWIGPGICQTCYEVGSDVLKTCQEKYPFALSAFKPHGEKWLANLALLAEMILKKAGVASVSHANACTFERKKDFFSYRRASQTGRIATLIWFNQGKNSHSESFPNAME